MNLMIHHNPTIYSSSAFEVDFDQLGQVNLRQESLLPFFEVRSTELMTDMVYNHTLFDQYLNVSFDLETKDERGDLSSVRYAVQNCTRE